MKFFLIFAATLLAVNALTEKQHWESFKVKYNKTYLNVAEETKRFQVFQENVKKINEHNERYEAGEETYSMAVNKFADMSEEEFGAMLRLKNGARPNVEGEMHVQVGSAPDSIDWRTKGAVLGVKNQLECGSCWAFSATGALEGQNAILKNKKVALSEQQLLDCSYGSTYGNGDCDQGGDMVAAFKYVKDHGLNSEAEYPYVGALKSCRAKSDSQVKVTGYKSIQRSEAALKQAVGTVGPISAAIYADPIQFYSSGIFNNYKCVSSYDKIDHGVLAVGYGTSPSDYWIIKNSWGADWGEHGFFRLARDHNMCGIQLDTSYPIVA